MINQKECRFCSQTRLIEQEGFIRCKRWSKNVRFTDSCEEFTSESLTKFMEKLQEARDE